LVAVYEYQADWSAAIATLESLSERLPGWPAFDRWLANLVARQGDIERARSLMANAFPEFLQDQVEILVDVDDLLAATVFAAILNANGEELRRDTLLAALEERIAIMHRIRGEGFGTLDVYIHAIRGDRDRAIAALREAIDMGWKVGQWLAWYDMRRDWKLANLHQDPEFIAIMAELEAGVREQRQWYEENKDKPLF
jgi:tetratricopeptide (TPR) repeat protein